ncbi:MAG: FecR domain-containing protein, partial [Planctomycetales bacterium]|nr:FecR domain-containing protein [Planctomycetales bacterium]
MPWSRPSDLGDAIIVMDHDVPHISTDNPSASDELRRLLDALRDRALADDDAERLDALLAADPAARRAYLEQVWDDAELHAMSVPLGSEAYDAPHPVGQSHRAATDGVSYSQRFSRWVANHPWMTIAASMLIAAFASAILARRDVDGTADVGLAHGMGDAASSIEEFAQAAPHRPAPGAAGQAPVAQITATRDCLWGSGTSSIGFSSYVYANQSLDLRAGLAEVTFANGAQILLEGPSQFVAPDAKGVELVAGKIAAAIPRAAKGFTVSTPRLSIDDAGTQFGLVVDRDGATELHVFEGLIRAHAHDEMCEDLTSVELTANEAMRLGPAATRFTPVNSNSDLFVRSLAPTAGPAEGLLAIEEFDYAAGPITWQNGGAGWAGPWADLDFEATPEGVATNLIAEGSLAGSTLVARGNRAVLTGRWNRMRRVLSTSLGGVFDAAGLVEDQDGMRLIGRQGARVYLSFLQRVSEVDDVFYGVELYRGDGNVNR